MKNTYSPKFSPNRVGGTLARCSSSIIAYNQNHHRYLFFVLNEYIYFVNKFDAEMKKFIILSDKIDLLSIGKI